MPLRYLRYKKETQKPDSDDSLRVSDTCTCSGGLTTFSFMFKNANLMSENLKPLPPFIYLFQLFISTVSLTMMITNVIWKGCIKK